MTDTPDKTAGSAGPPPARPKPWRDPRVLGVVYQLLTVGLVAWLGWVLFTNTTANMERRGITTGFDFLNDPAGFGILFALLPFDETMSYGRTFLVGLLNTILVSAIGIVFATILGFTMGIARLSKNWLVSRIALVYIETFRNIPVLLQIFFWYFAVLRTLPTARQSIDVGGAFFLNNRGIYMPAPVFEPLAWLMVGVAVAGVAVTVWLNRRAGRVQDATGDRPAVWPWGLGLIVGLPVVVYFVTGQPVSWEVPELRGFNFRGGTWVIPELAALTLALSIYTATFIAEIVRGGIVSVSWGQTEAAQALGLKQGTILRLIVIPQAMRVIIPPLTSQYLNLTKNSSLATAIGYPDLVSVFMGTTLNQTGQAVEVVAMTMAVYLTLSLSISAFMNWWNRRMALVER